MKRPAVILLWLVGLLCSFPVLAGVHGHSSVYVGGTVTTVEKGASGHLDTADKDLTFSPEKGDDLQIPYAQVTALDYGEHVGRRVGLAIVVAWPLLFSHKKRHYLTVYFNKDEAKAAEERDKIAKEPGAAPSGDVAAFEINKHDFEDVMDVLQAKTGLKVKVEEVSH
ncbi:MAG TPA: hypothetical protein VMT20_22970 [Terriglobia bacterium]|nr:hypothetical protein [Terriglobia bacterium]